MNSFISLFFFFNDTATTEIHTLSLHDALPISYRVKASGTGEHACKGTREARISVATAAQTAKASEKTDRKSTRLNSSHGYISYAVFCLKKKKEDVPPPRDPPDRTHAQSHHREN